VDRIARKCFPWVTFGGYVQKVGLNESLRVIISIQVEKQTDTASERKDVSS
jgi:TRAP-type C4-dicarboxylate transport system permease small subunit